MKFQPLPSNVTGAKSSAPDSERDRAGETAHESGLRFPVFNRSPSVYIDIVVLFGLIALISAIETQQLYTYKQYWASELNSLIYSVLPFLGFLLLFIREAFRSWLHRVAVVVIALSINVFAFMVNDWFYQVVIGIAALFYFLDLFFLHAIALRLNIVNDCEKHQAETVAEKRFSLSDNAPVNLLSYLFPLVVLAACSLKVRANLQSHLEAGGTAPLMDVLGTDADIFDPQRSGNELAFFILVFALLVFLPIILDHFAGRFGFQSFGRKRLWREYCDGLKSWFRYNSATISHPAVLQSPAGTNFQRRAMALGAVIFLVPIAMPTLLQTLQSDTNQKARNAFERTKYERFKFETRTSDDPTSSIQKSSSFRFVVYSPQDAFVSDSITIKPMPTPPDQNADVAKERALQEQRAQLENATDKVWAERSRAFTDDPVRLFVSIPNLLIILLGPIMPVLFFFAVIFAASARSMAILTDQLGPLPNGDQIRSENWSKIVSRLAVENTLYGRKEIFWGVDARDQTPILIPRSVIREHVHFLGDTGSGKTSMGIAPLLTQLVEGGDCSVIVIDLKADDQSLFELMRYGAAKNSQIDPSTTSDSKSWNYPFAYFTSKHNLPSHAFNPFLQTGFAELSPLQKTDLVTTSLGLQYGTDYGRKYFGDANFAALQKTLELFPEVQSFSELVPALKESVHRLLERETRQAASNLVMSIDRLAATPVVNATSAIPGFDPASLIDLGDLFIRPQAVYFSLPSATGSVVNADLGRLVLFSLINAAQNSAKPRKQVFLVIDEFQRLVSNHISVLLQMARGLDIGVILSNQSMSDLNQVDAKILSSVTTNTRIRQVFGISDPLEISQLIDISGERTVFQRTFKEVVRRFGLGFETDSRSFSETTSPRLRINDIIEASDNPFQSLFLMRRGTGNARFRGYPFVLESTFHISPEEYEKRALKAWPAPTPIAVVWQPPTANVPNPAQMPTPPTPSPLPTQQVAQGGTPQTQTQTEPEIKPRPLRKLSEGEKNALQALDDLQKKKNSKQN